MQEIEILPRPPRQGKGLASGDETRCPFFFFHSLVFGRSLRVEFLLKTESGYLRDAEVT